MRIAIGCDHAGYNLRTLVQQYLWENNIEFDDCGCFGEVCDYADVAKLVCKRVQDKLDDFGILVCGTGIGMCMSANKMNGIRAALCTDVYSAKCTRAHNDANVLCLGARVLGAGMTREILDAFLNTDFEGGRHVIRIKKMMELERK